jgi:ATP-dependent Zn protease
VSLIPQPDHKETRGVSEEIEDRKSWAYHEAGHAVVGAALGLTIKYASIVPSDGTLEKFSSKKRL